MLSPGSTNPKVTQGFEYVFRNCFIDPFQGTAMATYAMKPSPDGLGLKRFAVLYPVNSDYGVGLRGYIQDTVKKAGGEMKPAYGEINMGNSVYSTPIVADNVLYIANRTHLFAIENGAKPVEANPPAPVQKAGADKSKSAD
jgi:ABC-type branched-subunit amino acid transport system substrate-binding protein